MPSRRRAPKGCSLSNIRISISNFRWILRLNELQQNVTLFLREPLAIDHQRL
jgi:hypothetical protein